MSQEKKSFIELLQEINETSQPPQNEVDQDLETLPLIDEVDAAILMHRDAHFSGSFEAMIKYYEEDGKGASPEFSLNHIEQLWEAERGSEKNLAAIVLSGRDAELVAAAKEAYKKLRDLYDDENAPLTGRLITDLILSEEEPPQKEIDAILEAGRATVPALLELLHSDRFYSEFFPGYGQAPMLAAECLGKMGVEQAIKPLFEALGCEDFFIEESFISAIVAIGEPAKAFLLEQITARPLTADNERAAMILCHFVDEGVSKKCLEQLLDDSVMKISALAAHLVLACENLQGKEDQEKFRALAQKEGAPTKDIEFIAKQWT